MTRYALFSLLLLIIITPLYAKTILVIGDSLSAAHNIEEQSGWVNLLRKRMQQQKGDWQVVNLSASGDTSANGLAKMTRYLSTGQATVVIIELGANDGLRGLPLSDLKRNLAAMIRLANQKSVRVLLLATWLPPNYGPVFLRQFNQVYEDLAREYAVSFVPMFLQGVAGDANLMQSDGLHPSQPAQMKILDNIWPSLKPLL